QGHVDGVGTVVNVQEGGDWRLTIRPPKVVMRLLVPQGSVCVEGVSLTVAQLGADAFTVALIPTTLERTTLGTLKPGDRVNVEADVLVKAVVATVERMQLPGAERA
ncbi:MAG: riboflavin synthase, partial [bacterium]